MPAQEDKAVVDTHRQTVEVSEGRFRVYHEDDRFMVGRVPDGALLGYFKLELSTNAGVIVRVHATGQLGMSSFDHAREVLKRIGRLAVEHRLATA